MISAFLFLNICSKRDLEIQSFLNYIKCKEPTDELTDKISKLIDEIKNREQNKEAYMIEHLKVRDNIMEGLREGRIEGRKQGARQKAIEDAVILVQKYHATPEVAAKDMNAPLELVLTELEKISVKA